MISTKQAFLLSTILTLSIFMHDMIAKSGFFVYEELYFVKDVIDGDTIELTNGEKVRLIGINAPEINEPFGKEAKEFLSKMVNGKAVKLEKDFKLKDEYGRLLAFVFVDNININVEIVKNGLANTLYLSKLLKYSKELRKAELQAVENQIGIWKRSNITCIKLLDLKFIGEEKIVLKNNCKFSVELDGWSIEDESNNRFVFPSYLFRPNEIIEVYSTNKSAKFSFRKNFPIWNREGDTLFLRDSKGMLVLFYRY